MIHRKASLVFTVLLLLVAVADFPAVRADYPDNFNYPPGAPPPTSSPWTVSTDASGCYTGQVNQTALAFSGPTAFTMAQSNAAAGSCYATNHYVVLSTVVNNTASVIGVTWYQSMLNSHGGAGTKSTLPSGHIVFYVCIQRCVGTGIIYQNDTSSVTAGTATTAYWTQIGTTDNPHGAYVGPPAPATSYKIELEINATGTASSYWYTFALDNIVIKGANPIVKNYNFALADVQTHTWFNVTGYSQSHMTIQYSSNINCATIPNSVQASANTCGVNNLQIPDLVTNLSGATLIQVWVGGTNGYTRTLIPSPFTSADSCDSGISCQYFYLDEPGSLVPYTLTIDDLTGNYAVGTTQIYLIQGTTVITSGYMDAQGQFGMTVQAGQYTLKIYNPATSSTFTEPITLTTTNELPKVLIQSSSFTTSVGPLQQFGLSAGWDCDLLGITANFNDNLAQTTAVWMTVQQVNSSNTQNWITYHTTGAFGLSTHDFRNNTGGLILRLNVAAQYYIQYNVTEPSGTYSLGPFAVNFGNSNCPQNFPSLVPAASSFQIPASILGLASIFAISNAYEALLACIVIVMTAGIFGARMAHVGLLVVAGEMGLFYLMAWLPISSGVISVFLFIGSLGLLVNRSRRPIT